MTIGTGIRWDPDRSVQEFISSKGGVIPIPVEGLEKGIRPTGVGCGPFRDVVQERQS